MQSAEAAPDSEIGIVEMTVDSELSKSETTAGKVRRKYGAYLKRERESRRYTQKYVADYLGFRTPQLISNWERGIAAPPLKEVKKLAQLYLVDKNELMDMVTEYHEAMSHDALDTIRKIFTDRVFSKAQTRLDS